jgi:hypothetical protein
MKERQRNTKTARQTERWMDTQTERKTSYLSVRRTDLNFQPELVPVPVPVPEFQNLLFASAVTRSGSVCATKIEKG